MNPVSYTHLDVYKRQAQCGVDVRIITPHIADKWYVHAVTRANYDQLVYSGVKIYEYTPGFIHAKTIVADDEYAIVGTQKDVYKRQEYYHLKRIVQQIDPAAFIIVTTASEVVGEGFKAIDKV